MLRKTNLHTIIAFLLALLTLTFALAGCSEKNDEPAVFSQQEELTRMLDSIRDYRSGTLGSSLRLCIVAFKFLNFAEDFDQQFSDDFTAFTDGYLSALDMEEIIFIKDTVAGIQNTAYGLFTNGIESLEGLLSDSGNPNKYDSYTEEKYRTLMTLFEGVLDNYQ